MAMVVDKARRDDLPAGIHGLIGRPGQLAYLGDLAVLDADIAHKGRHPGAVHNPPVPDQQIIRHRFPPLRWFTSVPLDVNYITAAWCRGAFVQRERRVGYARGGPCLDKAEAAVEPVAKAIDPN